MQKKDYAYESDHGSFRAADIRNEARGRRNSASTGIRPSRSSTNLQWIRSPPPDIKRSTSSGDRPPSSAGKVGRIRNARSIPNMANSDLESAQDDSYDRDLGRPPLRPKHKKLRWFSVLSLGIALVLLLDYSWNAAKVSKSASAKVVSLQKKVLPQRERPSWVLPDLSPVPETLPRSSISYCEANLGTITPQPATIAVKGYSLVHVQIALRHGDRSAIHTLPGADETKWICSPLPGELQPEWENTIKRFPIVDPSGKPLERSLWSTLLPKNEAENGAGESEGYCEPGQLTHYGIRQLMKVGRSLGTAYWDLFSWALKDEKTSKGRKHVDLIQARSTDYTRTLMSSAAFLTGFLENQKGVSGTDKVPIMTNPDENAEVMHGIGLKASTNVAGGGEKTLVGECALAVSKAEYQVDMTMSSLRTDVKERLREGFGDSAADDKITRLTDNVYARTCHSMTLPCSTQSGECMTNSLALAMVAESDRLLCATYMGAQGGMVSSGLSIYPFMAELLANMDAAVKYRKPAGNATEEADAPPTFLLYVGHDTVIAPVLASLGAYDCRWPPYASHVEIELWEKTSENGTTPAYFFRLLYNSRPVTHFANGCHDVKNLAGSDAGLCPMETFRRNIEKLLAPFTTLEEACTGTYKKKSGKNSVDATKKDTTKQGVSTSAGEKNNKHNEGKSEKTGDQVEVTKGASDSTQEIVVEPPAPIVIEQTESVKEAGGS